MQRKIEEHLYNAIDIIRDRAKYDGDSSKLHDAIRRIQSALNLMGNQQPQTEEN